MRIQVPHDLETFLRGRNGGLFTAGGKMFLTFSENTQKLTPNADLTTGADLTTAIGPDAWSGPCRTSSYMYVQNSRLDLTYKRLETVNSIPNFRLET